MRALLILYKRLRIRYLGWRRDRLFRRTYAALPRAQRRAVDRAMGRRRSTGRRGRRPPMRS